MNLRPRSRSEDAVERKVGMEENSIGNFGSANRQKRFRRIFGSKRCQAKGRLWKVIDREIGSLFRGLQFRHFLQASEFVA